MLKSRRIKELLTKLMVISFGLIFLGGSFYQFVGMVSIPPEQLMGRAEVALNGQKYTEAMALLKQAEEKVPLNARVSELQGDVYRQQKKYRQAKKRMKKP